MPYIYSLAWKVSHDDYTIQRPLVMDFRRDPLTWNIGDQFMFGPALMVNPVVEAKATERRVYLPKDAVWYDFWTGEKLQGGQHIQASAPLDRIPLYVRGGSILPLGPEEEYADEKPDGPFEVRVYPGADASFTLYEDEGDNYDYEKGKYALVPLTWSEADHTLTIGDRTGSYPGMPKTIVFHLVVPHAGHGVGGSVVDQPDKTVEYQGRQVTVRMQ
jgi:alpha-D-xyloside xylohydrolase